MINNNNNSYGMYISRKLYKYIICLNIYIYISKYHVLQYIGPSGPSQLWIRNHGGRSPVRKFRRTADVGAVSDSLRKYW